MKGKADFALMLVLIVCGLISSFIISVVISMQVQSQLNNVGNGLFLGGLFFFISMVLFSNIKNLTDSL
jgi:hypothetical protein